MATILAIETSCDETAVAIVKNRYICSNIVASQISAHQPYGGRCARGGLSSTFGVD